MRLTRLIVACALVLAALPARAQDASIEEARSHAQKAKVHYDLGEFQAAAEEYIAVYRIKPIPQLLFNIAQAYRQASLYEKAKQFYRAYLREGGADVKNRGAVEKAIKEIDELLAKEKHTREVAPTGVAQQDIAPGVPPSLPLPEKSEKTEKPKAVAHETPAPQPQPEASKPPAKAAVEVAVAKPPPAKPLPPAAVPSERPQAQPVVAEESSPFYKKWWFWTAVGAVAVGGGVAAATTGGNAAPPSHFGTAKVF